MARVLTALVLGVLLGTTAGWLLKPTPLALQDLGDLRPVVTATPANAIVSTAAREGGPDFYRRLAEANASELASMIRQAAEEPSSTERELALAVLLKRHSELDALGAVRLAREAGVSGMALSAVYGAWARKAPAQALAALSTVENADAAAAVAIALIAALGNDSAAFGRVAAVLAARENEESFAPATPSSAPFTPAGPAVSVVSPRSALGVTAQKWADLDPRRAISVARELDDERLALALESAALRALARVSPDEAFAHFSTLGGDPQRLSVLNGVWGELARADPERLLASITTLPADSRRMAEQIAVQQLAERDPLAAARYLERMPFTPERQGIMTVVARSYGRRDPVAALAWARSLRGQDFAVSAVLGGVAEQDPQRAMDLALSLTAPNERMRAVQFIAMTGTRDDTLSESIANRLLTIDDRQLRESVGQMLVMSWSQRSPDGAMRWLLANGQTVSPNMFMQVGQQMAMRDPRNALAQSAQVPAAAREQWMQGVAQGYAQNDPQGAIEWLAQYRAEPWYARAAWSAATQVAQRDGAAAARLIEGVDTERAGGEARQLVNMVASSWANQDPAAAAEWAMDRRSEQERTMAVRSVVATWASQDLAGARQWALRLPQGTVRDVGLTTVLSNAVQRSGALDTSVLNAFSSDAARQQAVMQAVQGLAYNDPARARAVVDGFTDPSLRAEAERVLANTRQQRPLPIGISVGQ